MEEVAAREVQKSRFDEMDHDDFELSDDDKEEASSEKKTQSLDKMRDIASLGQKERRKLLKLQHPELLPIVSHFASVAKRHNDSTQVATRTLLENDEAAKVRYLCTLNQAFMIGFGMVRFVRSMMPG